MPDFSKGKIYKLVSNKSSDVYIGSCLVDLSKRLYGHKAPSNKCVSKGMFVNDAIISIVLIEDYPCENKNQLKARELHYITTINCININKPFITDVNVVNGDSKEWKKIYNDTNKEQITQYKAQYRETNKEQLLQKRKQYYETNKEQLLQKQKQYHETNKEQIVQKQKQYNETHKEQIAQYRETHKEQIAQQKAQYYQLQKLKQSS